MADDGEHELTDDDRRILKYLADAAREEMPSRRGFIQGTSAAVALGALGFGAGSATAQTQDPAGQVGTESNPVDLIASSVEYAGPVRVSSAYGSYQAAVDDAAGGLLYINDTKREEGISLSPTHNGTTIVGVGNHTVQKPSSPTDGTATFEFEDDISNNVEDITWINVTVENPDLTDGDIDNENNRNIDNRRSAWEPNAPNVTSANGTQDPVDWTFINCTADHVQGHGFKVNFAKNLKVKGCTSRYTAFDGFYSQPRSDDPALVFDGCTSYWAGRHNISMAGNATEGSVHITDFYGEDAHTGGIDLEHAQNVTLDATIRNSGRGGSTGAVYSGLNISAGSEKIGGRVVVHDPNGKTCDLSGPHADDLTVIGHQSAASNPNGAELTQRIENMTGQLTLKQFGGGGASSGSIMVIDTEGLDLRAHVEDSYGPSFRVFDGGKHKIDLVSIDPVQGGSDVDADSQAHLLVDGSPTGVTATVTAIDNDGNANYGISAPGSADYNRYEGSVRGAYSTSATNGIGSNSDTSSLIT